MSETMSFLTQTLKSLYNRDFPGGPGIKTPWSSCRGAWVWSLVRELRSHMPHGAVKISFKEEGFNAHLKCCAKNFRKEEDAAKEVTKSLEFMISFGYIHK